MLNVFSEYMKDYWDSEESDSQPRSKDEMLVAFVDQSNRIVYPKQMKIDSDFCRERLGEVIECSDMSIVDGCGNGPLCEDCPIRQAIRESYDSGEPVIKRIISKEMNYDGKRNKKFFQLTTNFMGDRYDRLLLIFDDVTSNYLSYKLRLLEENMIRFIDSFSYDEIAADMVQQLGEIIGSESVVLSVMNPSLGFSQPSFSAGRAKDKMESRHCNEFINRKLWLECVTKGHTVIENDYAQKQDDLGGPNECGINRIMMVPVMDEGSAIGFLINVNKDKPYDLHDKHLVEHLAETLVNVIHVKP